jgi:hypothetical protein
LPLGPGAGCDTSDQGEVEVVERAEQLFREKLGVRVSSFDGVAKLMQRAYGIGWRLVNTLSSCVFSFGKL